MTDIKKAYAALVVLEWADFDNIGFIRELKECAPVVKKALKAYIEREQGWRDIKEGSLPNDGEWVMVAWPNGAMHYVRYFKNENNPGAVGEFGVCKGNHYAFKIGMNKWLRITPPTPTEQGEV